MDGSLRVVLELLLKFLKMESDKKKRDMQPNPRAKSNYLSAITFT